jgi:hypothetical protein
MASKFFCFAEFISLRRHVSTRAWAPPEKSISLASPGNPKAAAFFI